MQDWIMQVITQFGYVGIAFLVLLENIFPPIPSEVILVFGGVITAWSELTVWGVIVASTVGSMLGAVLLYLVGKIFEYEKIEKWLNGKVGKILHFKSGDVKKAVDWFDSKGIWTVFFCRFIPIVRSLISVPAGMTKMKFGTFFAFTLFGTIIWNTVLVWLGRFAGESWETVVANIDTYSMYALVVILIVCVFYILRKTSLKKRSFRR